MLVIAIIVSFIAGVWVGWKGIRLYAAHVSGLSMDEIEEAGDMTAKKLVTKYQGSYIEAWYGNFILSGKRKYLDFLYQTGLGSKNSQGFGMFNII